MSKNNSATTVAAAAAPVVEAPAATVSKARKMKHSSDIISPARIRFFLDKLGLNKAIDADLAPIVAKIREHDAAVESLKNGTKPVTRIETVVTKHTVTGADGVAVEVEKTKQVKHAETAPLTAEDRAALEALIAATELEKLKINAAALRSSQIRFSSDAPLAVSVICNRAFSELIEHALGAVLAQKKKILHSDHLFSAGVKNLSLYPLFSSLPSFVAGLSAAEIAAQEAEIAKQVKEATKAAIKAWRAEHPTPRAKKGAKKGGKKAAAAAVEEPVAVEEQPAVVEEPVAADNIVPDSTPALDEDGNPIESFSASKSAFKFYVGNICNTVRKKSPEFESVRVSNEVRVTLSTLLVELIGRFARLMKLMTESMNIKTVNSDAVLRVAEMILIDGHEAVDSVELTFIDEPSPAALEAEKAAKKADPKYVRKPLSELATHKVFAAVRSTKYPTSAFGAVADEVAERLSAFAAAKAAAAETAEVAAAKVVA